MKILSVVGARPQFIKLAPVDLALRHCGYEHVIVHTGQHYDRLMSQVFFDDLGIGPPAANLGIGSGSHAAQTAGILTDLDPILQQQWPDWVLVYGDTNTTLGSALTALAAEGLQARTVLVGDVMVDALAAMQARIESAPGHYMPACLPDGPYLLATLHRPETTDDAARLAATLHALAGCPLPVILLAHPRLRDRADRLGIPLPRGALHVAEPLQYPSMIAAMSASRGLITDSGGLQKEALLLGVPCTTLRSRTEWPETLQGSWNVLVHDPQELVAAVSRPRPPGRPPTPFGDGAAAGRVAAELGSWQPSGGPR